MYKIEVCNENLQKLFNYESDILPMTGDDYAGINFTDGKQRTVTNRLLYTHPNCKTITVYTKLSH